MTNGAARIEDGESARIDEVAHLSLLAGRLLLLNGADTGQVEADVMRFAAAFGCEAHLLINYEGILLTAVSGDRFRTKIGHRLPAMNVGMGAVGAVDAAIDGAVSGRLDLAQARAALEAAEHLAPAFGRWVVVLLLGLTAACLSRLFGGDWPTFAVAWLAGAAGTWLRQELGRRRVNPVAIPCAASLLGGLIGGAAVASGLSGTPSLCLVAPAMIIMPGVPLINGVQDMIRNHVTQGVSRLGFACLVTAAIGLGLFAATVLTGADIPVQEPARSVGVLEDAVFSAVAALGYAALFSVPARMAWACALCGVASHTTRTLLAHLGVDLIGGTLVGALAAGFLAQLCARAFRAPSAAFAFPGVVAMVPGAYAFRAILGALQIAHGSQSDGLAVQTLNLGLMVVLMTGAIGVGIAASAVFPPRAGVKPVPPPARVRTRSAAGRRRPGCPAHAACAPATKTRRP